MHKLYKLNALKLIMPFWDKFKSKQKKEDVIDYTKNYRLEQQLAKRKYGASELQANKVADIQTENISSLRVLDSTMQSSSAEQEQFVSSGFSNNPSIEQKGELSKHLTKLTERCEDLSNQIYRLQQRIELLEQRIKSGGISS
jgi:vacuolar-type H+-ATPase subunit D/Vma8